MKNIWKIFQRDLQQIQKNVIAMIVIIGITVVPCLYAWFNIAASWDPYENTGNLKVAVASVDEGYEGSIIPVQLTLGDQVLSALRENTQLECSRLSAVTGFQPFYRLHRSITSFAVTASGYHLRAIRLAAVV